MSIVTAEDKAELVEYGFKRASVARWPPGRVRAELRYIRAEKAAEANRLAVATNAAVRDPTESVNVETTQPDADAGARPEAIAAFAAEASPPVGAVLVAPGATEQVLASEAPLSDLTPRARPLTTENDTTPDELQEPATLAASRTAPERTETLRTADGITSEFEQPVLRKETDEDVTDDTTIKNETGIPEATEFPAKGTVVVDSVQAEIAPKAASTLTGNVFFKAEAELRAISGRQGPVPPDGPKKARPTPQSVIEAVLTSVCARGPAALGEPKCVERLSRCDAAAKAQINERIAKLEATGLLKGGMVLAVGEALAAGGDKVKPKPSSTPERSNSHEMPAKQAPMWSDGMITARALCSMKFAPLKYIVPKMIPEGLTILAGRPKIGKSWLVLLLGIVLSNGVSALGLDYGIAKPLKGTVLYLGLEDGRRRLQRRMTKLIGALPENWPEELHLKTEWRRLDQGGLDDIRAWYRSVKDRGGNPIMVVVDTLAKVRAPTSSKSSPYQNDHDALAGLQKLAEALGIAVVVNHHDRKMDADDVFDTVSGTLGLTGAVDTILVLTKKAGAVTLHVRGRDIEEEVSLAMRFNKADCRWSVTGTVEAQQEAYRSDERTRVLAALATAPEGLSSGEIVVGAQLLNRNAADNLLFNMAKAGDVERIKRGLYGLPGTKEKIVAQAKVGQRSRPTLTIVPKDEVDAKDAKKLRSDLSPLKSQEDGPDLSNLSDLSVLSGTTPSAPNSPALGPTGDSLDDLDPGTRR